MLSLPSTVRIFVAAEPVDLRRGFDGLAAVTRSVVRQDPLSGHLFVFLNRRRDRAGSGVRHFFGSGVRIGCQALLRPPVRGVGG